ncbi:branched-chain amino acid ABC transporter permease [Neopusillimonas maritima]|jgi:branched-chain amino acid transport system permease protein|uniref:Branched-chain amino acid ABC transporter permease n=1 Tax=Neopusillimonas maritima TaxID=2026239 RepID=A0A3A1YV21_9BURK|nr:branched-chain amino acid ABC transporter permease [Neopusillimonas maritima]RII84314.1 branched-chain amino acid ABC transporter permease [Neopusillimonas maritima]RIY42052.1 branched-chain amino acid ABC transporter permease [Neopusillimonas maritima]
MHSSIRNFILPLLLFVVTALLPLVTSEYYTALIVKIMIYSLFALSLQLLVGCTGLISLGHAAFFGISAYAVTLLSPQYESGNLLWMLPVSIGIAMVYALITGALSLRTKGVYFIMVTLAFAQMAYYVFHDTKIGGGSDGIYLYVRPEFRIGDWVILNLDNAYVFYMFVLVCLTLTWVFLAMLMRSRFGAALTGILVNEQRMRAAGFSTFGYKLTAYIIASGLGGLAGILYAAKDGYVNPELMNWEQSGLVLLMVILGGMGRLSGAVIGTITLILLQEIFQSQALFGEFAVHWHLTFGLAIIILVALMPKGLIGLPEQLRARRRSSAGSPAAH